jgi:hypothetical protein
MEKLWECSNQEQAADDREKKELDCTQGSLHKAPPRPRNDSPSNAPNQHNRREDRGKSPMHANANRT